MKALKKPDFIRLILCGGEIRFPADKYEPQEEPVVLATSALRYSLLALVILAILPLAFLQSSIGIIDYKYPSEYADRSALSRYVLGFVDNLLIVTRATRGIDAIYSDDIPVPEDAIVKRVVGLLFWVGDFLIVGLIIRSAAIIRNNITQLRDSHGRLEDASIEKEIKHECIL